MYAIGTIYLAHILRKFAKFIPIISYHIISCPVCSNVGCIWTYSAISSFMESNNLKFQNKNNKVASNTSFVHWKNLKNLHIWSNWNIFWLQRKLKVIIFEMHRKKSRKNLTNIPTLL